MRVKEHERRARILFVDDEPNLLKAIERCLRNEGYELFFTTDPTQAAEIVRTESIDVVVTDQLMPAKQGTTLLRELQPHRCAHTIMTGILDEGPVLAGVSEGIVDDYLLKPFAATKLRNFIRAVVPPAMKGGSVPSAAPLNAPDATMIVDEGT